MSVDAGLLDVLCCPVTRLPLEPMPARTLSRLNELVAERRITTRDDTVVVEPLDEALVTRDGKLAYPVRDGVPVLLEEHAIALAQLGDS